MVQIDKDRIIVKIQLSLVGNKHSRGVLIYSWDNTIRFEGEASKDIIKKMKGRDKIYYYAKLNGTELSLLEETSKQSW